MRVVVFGPGPAFKGGIAAYTASLAQALDALRADPAWHDISSEPLEVHLVSWTQQYPALIPRDFIDRASRRPLLEGTQVTVHYLTDYNNPLTWAATVRQIIALQPRLVVLQWAIALQGLPLGWIARRLLRYRSPDGRGIEVLFDCHLVVQKEASALDRRLTRYGLAQAHGYIVHADKTARELREAFPDKTFGERAGSSPERPYILSLFHPVYALHPAEADFDRDALKAQLGLRQHVFLFFGFIRPYKGLHWCLRALAELLKTRSDVSLLIAGESFWQTVDDRQLGVRLKRWAFGLLNRLLRKQTTSEQDYRPLELIEALGLQSHVAVVNRYIPNEEVARYWQVSDAVLLFYETATPSGVESQAYHYGLPMLATRVGHFPETIHEGVNGYLAEPADPVSMAAAMQRALASPIASEAIKAQGRRLSWARYARAVMGLPTD